MYLKDVEFHPMLLTENTLQRFFIFTSFVAAIGAVYVLWCDILYAWMQHPGALTMSPWQRKRRRRGHCCGLCSQDKAGLSVSSELCSPKKWMDTHFSLCTFKHTGTGRKYVRTLQSFVWRWSGYMRYDNRIYPQMTKTKMTKMLQLKWKQKI